MARKTNTKIESNRGSEYNYCRKSPTVEKYNEETGQWYKGQKQFYGISEKDVDSKIDAYKKWVQEKKAAIENERYQRTHLDERAFGESVKKYIQNVFLPNSKIKTSTKSRYINAYKSLFDGLDILSIPLGEITGEALQEAFTHSSIAPSSKKAALKFIRGFYKYCVSQHITQDISGTIIIPNIEKKRKDQEIEIYTDDELRTFQEKTPSDHRLRFLIILAIYTGCRINELCALTYDDIDIAGEKIVINKGLAEISPIRMDGIEDVTSIEITSTKSVDSNRVMPINEIIKSEYYNHRRWHKSEMVKNGYRTDYIFTTSTGSLYYKSTLRKALARLCNRIGLESKGWHAFRHTFGTRLARNGTPIQTVSKMMGHSDISVTAKYYINISTDEKKAALDLLAL